MVVALQICSCMLSDPVHLRPQILKPYSTTPPTSLPSNPLQKLVEPRSPVDVLASPRTSVSHPAPIFQMPCPPQPVSHVFCTALCVCHVHSVDTSLCSPYLPFSHLHCLSLRPGFIPSSTLLSLEDRNEPDFYSPPPSSPKSKSSLHWAVDFKIYEIKCWLFFLILDWFWTSIIWLN